MKPDLAHYMAFMNLNSWRAAAEMLADLEAESTRRYAIGFLADQTITYLCAPGGETTKHSEALLYRDLDAAVAQARKYCRPEESTHELDFEHAISISCSCAGWFVERVDDEAEFRSRDDTW